jgi:hypothetical protein
LLARSLRPEVTEPAATPRPAVPAPGEQQRQTEAAGEVRLRRAGSDPLDGLLVHAVLQRTMEIKPSGATAASVHERLLERKDILPEDAEALLRGRLGVEKVAEGLKRLSSSATPYGTFDLVSDDVLLLLFFELRKHVEQPRTAPDPGDELTVEEAEGRATSAFEAYSRCSPDPEATYEVAFLGAGAATAYYMTSAPNPSPRARTVVVGPRQPWGGERGPGVINHPMHMISPRRDAVGLGDESLAPREQFSGEVEKVLATYAGQRLEAKVTKVEKVANSDRQFYKLTLDSSAVLYARRVVAGLGIGPHVRTGLNDAGTSGLQDPLVCGEPETARALDLDEFQRRAESIRAQGRATVVISGPNAGIDAVMTSLRLGFDIVWVLGATGKPGLLPGTDNEIVELEYKRRVGDSSPAIRKYVQGRAQGAVRAPKSGEGKPAGKPILVKVNEQPDIPADYFVMAAGPDVQKIVDVFDRDTVRAHLVPTYDRNRQFNDPRSEGLPTVVGIHADNEDPADETALEIIGGSAYRMAISPDLRLSYDYLDREWSEVSRSVSQMAALEGRFTGMSSHEPAPHPEIVEAMGELYRLASAYRFGALGVARRIQRAQSTEGLPALPPLPDFAPAAKVLTGVELDKRRQQVVRGFLGMVRAIERYARMLALYRQRVEDFFAKKGRDPRIAGESMKGVIGSLPLNIAMNDQLTPTRSQIEATYAFVPSYVAKDVNFATDGASVLQIYIATNFPDLEDSEVDMWVDRIIRWRRPEERAEEWKDYPSLLGPLPNPLGASRDRGAWFSERFKGWLAEANTEARKRNAKKRRALTLV